MLRYNVANVNIHTKLVIREFVHWLDLQIGLELSFILAFTMESLFAIKLFIFVKDMTLLSNDINIYEYIVNIIDISEYIHWICMCIGSSSQIALLLKPTRTNLRASGVRLL